MAADLALREALRAYDDDDEDDDGGGGVGGIGGSEPPRPNAVTFGVVMSAWGRQQRRHQRRNRRQRQPRGGRRGRDRGDPDDSEEEKEDPASRALSLLGEMAARYAATGDPAWRPNAYVVCGAARILARSGGGGGGGVEGGGGEAAVRGADALLRSLEGMALPGSGSGGGGNGGGNGVPPLLADLIPDSVTYTQVMGAYAAAGGEGAGEAAEALLDRMEAMDRAVAAVTAMSASGGGERRDASTSTSTSTFTPIRPDRVAYSMAIKAHGAAGTVDGAERAEALLGRMERRYAETGDPGLRPDAVAYTGLIRAWTGRERRRRQERRERRRRNTGGSGGGRDDTDHGDPDGGDPDGGDPDDGAGSARREGMERAERAEFLLRALADRHAQTGDPALAPDALLYGTVMDAYAALGGRDAAERCEELLRRMVLLYEATTTASGADADADADADAVKADLVAYTICMKAWASCGDAEGALRADAILHGMLQRYQATGDTDVKPDGIAFCLVMDGWAGLGTAEAAGRCEALAAEMAQLYEDWRDSELRTGPDAAMIGLKAWRGARDAEDGEVVRGVERVLEGAVERCEAAGWDGEMMPTDAVFEFARRVAKERTGYDAGEALGTIDRLQRRVALAL